MNVLVPGDQLGRDRNARRRLDLVTGQHPNLDTRVPQKFQRALDLVLQLVFDTRQTQKFKILLKTRQQRRSWPRSFPQAARSQHDVAP